MFETNRSKQRPIISMTLPYAYSETSQAYGALCENVQRLLAE